MKTKEQILESMIAEMPFTLATNNEPYILEAMEIYANQVKNHGDIGTVVDSFVDILQRLVELKNHKDKHGKDSLYVSEQPILWEMAREKLKEVRESNSL